MKVKIYSTQACPYCVKAKEWLKNHNVGFEEIDVSKDTKKAEEIIDRTGQIGVPVIEIDGKLVVGFNEEKLKKLLKL